MDDELELAQDDEELVEVSTALKIVAPVVAFGAAWLVRKALDTAYTKATGNPPPRATDRHASMRRVLVYAAVTAAAVAVVNVAIDRATAPKIVHRSA